MAGKKRGSKLRFGAIALVGVASLATAPYALKSLVGDRAGIPGAAYAEELMAMLDGRSPGERVKGALTTKIKARKQVAQTKPPPRVLGKIARPKPPTPEEFVRVLTPVVPDLVIPPMVPPTLAEIVTPALTPPPGGGVILPPVGSGPPGLPGTPGTPNTPNIPETPPVPPPIPEPATWMMMLLGFGVIGWTARRRGGLTPAAAPLA